MRQVPVEQLADTIIVKSPQSFRLVAPFFIVIILDAIGFGIISPLLAPLVAQASHVLWGAHASSYVIHILYGLILAAFPISYMIGAPILGALSDYLGRKQVLFFCLVGVLIGFICYVLSFSLASISLLILGRVLAGFTSGSQGVAQAAMADISLASKDKAINIGMIAVAMTLGLVLGPLVGGELSNPKWISWFSLTTPFYFVILLSIFNLFILLIWVKSDNNISHQAVLPHLTQHWQNFIALFKSTKICLLLVVFFFFELGWSLYYQSLALFLAEQFHFQAQTIGLFLTYVGIILSFGLIAIVRLAVNYLKLKTVIFIALLIGVISLIAVYGFHLFIGQCLLVIPVTFAVALIYTSLITLVSNLVAKDQQGLLMGTTDGLLALAFAITGFLAGWLAYFNINLPFLVAGCFWLVALIIVRIIYGLMS